MRKISLVLMLVVMLVVMLMSVSCFAQTTDDMCTSLMFNVVPQDGITQVGGMVFITPKPLGAQFGFRYGTALNIEMSSFAFGINETITKDVQLYQNISFDTATASFGGYSASASKCNFEFGLLLAKCAQLGFITDRNAIVLGFGIPLK